MRVDLNLFKVFDIIYAERNISRAAEVLNLTQPAVSHALARLREQFNDPLFVRQGKWMQPTTLSKNVIADVRAALHQLDVCLQQSRIFNPDSSTKQFVISLHDLLESSYLPLISSTLETEAPNVRLNSVKAQRRDMETLLASGAIDFAIDVLLPVSERVHHQPIRRDSLAVVIRKDHPLLIGREHTLTEQDYLTQQHVMVSSRSSGLGLEDFELGRLGLQRKVGLRCQHFFAASRVVEQTDMLLTMPDTPAHIINKGLGNRILPLPIKLPPIDVHLYWHESLDRDPANQWLREQLLTLTTSTNVPLSK